MGDAPTMLKRFFDGQISYKQMLEEMAESSASKLYSTITPLKSLAETFLGKSGFPSIIHPRMVRDKYEELFRIFNLDPEYRALSGRPGMPYLKQRNPLWATLHLDEQNYWEIRTLKREYMRDKLGRGQGEGAFSTLSQAYYNYRKAKLYDDDEALNKAADDIEAAGGSLKGLKQSIRTQAPLHGLKKEDKEKFLEWLTPSQREILQGANNWYDKLEYGIMK